MEIEHLNKTQIVLLTLLVGFVTSIATGIVTVSLLDQAPKTVTQTINRVVEHTVERVVPSIVEKPVVIKDEDLIVQSIEQNQKSIVKIFTPFDGASARPTFLGYGAFISKDGILMSDAGIAIGFTSVGIELPDGTKMSANRLETKSSKRIHLYRAEFANATTESDPVKFANSDVAKLGQTVIGMGGDGVKDSVAIGIISGFIENALGRVAIETSLDEKNPGVGRFLVNLSGELVGFSAVNEGPTRPKSTYTPINLLKPEMELVEKTPAPIEEPKPPVTVTPVDTTPATTTATSTATTTAVQ